jgi:IMP dehydrogenase
MDTLCSEDMLRFLYNQKSIVTIHRFFESANQQLSLLGLSLKKSTDLSRVFLAIGSKARYQDWIDTLIEVWHLTDYKFGFLLDMANGDTRTAIETVRYVREQCKNANIMAGNVATKSGYEHLTEAGANLIRVGIGGGATCTTRSKTGFGIPVLTSLLDCAQSKREDTYLIADGGIEDTGDICKAMAAGADAVMCGKIFAATSLASGNVVVDKQTGYSFKQYHGMASKKARAKLKNKTSSIEGAEGYIQYTGETEEVFGDMLANLRSSMVYYGGCDNWRDFYRKAKFEEITPTGLTECGIRIKV